VLVSYGVQETEGNGKGSLPMCGGLVQGRGDGGNWNGFSADCGGLVQVLGNGVKWKGFSGDVCWFRIGWGKRRELVSFEW
jgi:hypothetical protein